MRLKTLFARLAWCAAGLIALALTHDILERNVEKLAAMRAPKYVPLSQEELHKRAGLPCTRPAGTKMGCAAPTFEGSADSDYFVATIIRSREQIYQQRLASPAREHEEKFRQHEILPRAEQLRYAYNIAVGVMAAIILFLAVLVLRKWWAGGGLSAIFQRLGKLKYVSTATAWISINSARRKMRQAEADYLTLKNLLDNGLITQEVFENRKSELRLSLSPH